MHYRVGTRGSGLALIQTGLVIEKMKERFPMDTFETVVIKTTGDKNREQQLDQIGAKGIFVEEIERELLNGSIDFAVHSMKDMPDTIPEGLVFARAWRREDARDVLVLRDAKSLEELPTGAVIASGSKRRSYQLLKLRPDLKVVGIRGNVDTRLRRLREGLRDGTEIDGLVLAAAGLKRLGRESEITRYFSEQEMIPAPAQGTLAIEVKAENLELLEKLDSLSDEETELCVRAERGFLKEIGGDCHLPVGAFCKKDARGNLQLLALFGTEDGRKLATTKVSVSLAGADTKEKQLQAVQQLTIQAADNIRTELWEK